MIGDRQYGRCERYIQNRSEGLIEVLSGNELISDQKLVDGRPNIFGALVGPFDEVGVLFQCRGVRRRRNGEVLVCITNALVHGRVSNERALYSFMAEYF